MVGPGTLEGAVGACVRDGLEPCGDVASGVVDLGKRALLGPLGVIGTELAGGIVIIAPPGVAAPASSAALSQYFEAVLMRASAAMRKTPDVATTSPALSPASTS